eukprot:14200442-Alexandrium_andersonii.AAC.1
MLRLVAGLIPLAKTSASCWPYSVGSYRCFRISLFANRGQTVAAIVAATRRQIRFARARAC